jgi:hypothetical protein
MFLRKLGEVNSRTEVTFDPLDEAEWRDRFERILADEPARVSTSVSWHLVLKTEMPIEATADPTEVGPPAVVSEIVVKPLRRTTKRKADKYRPNCFGSQSLHDPESADCRSCKFSEGCKKTIAKEMALLETASKARKAHFKPSADPAQLKAQGVFIRARYLREFRKSLKKRQLKDLVYQRDKRANSSVEALIKKESKRRLTALRSATARLRRDKRLEQVRGREQTIIAVWAARQYARFVHGSGASDAEVAKSFEKLGGGPFTRYQARSYRLLFKRLAGSLKKAPLKTTGTKPA